MRTHTLAIPAVLSLAGIAMLSGCYTPGGGLFSYTGGPQTYVSTETVQKTITVIDKRSGETIFTVDVPAGQQLVIQFDKDEGDDPVYTPDLMRYELMPLGTLTGKLSNAMTVPNAASRLVDVSVRQTVEYTPAGTERALRTDEMKDRPDWWTPKGGPLPQDTTVRMYDN